jgi:hypothetical protein
MEVLSLRSRINSCFLTQSIYSFLCCKPFVNFIIEHPERLRPTNTSEITKKYIVDFSSEKSISNFSLELYDELVPKLNRSFTDNRLSTQKPAGDFIDIWLDELGNETKKIFRYLTELVSFCPCGKRIGGEGNYMNPNIWRFLVPDSRPFVDQVCLTIDSMEIKCERCNKKNIVRRFERLKLAPPIFVFYLYPTILPQPLPEFFTISNKNKPTLNYELMCVILHTGNNDGGHFITQGKLGKKIFNMEGENVREISSIEKRININFAFYCKL